MIHDRKFRTALAVVLVTVSAAPAFAQNRFQLEAKEKAARREENKAVREAEHPDAAPKTASAAPATAAPAEVAAPAEAAAPAAPAPAAPAPAAPAAPAPAQ